MADTRPANGTNTDTKSMTCESMIPFCTYEDPTRRLTAAFSCSNPDPGQDALVLCRRSYGVGHLGSVVFPGCRLRDCIAGGTARQVGALGKRRELRDRRAGRARCIAVSGRGRCRQRGDGHAAGAGPSCHRRDRALRHRRRRRSFAGHRPCGDGGVPGAVSGNGPGAGGRWRPGDHAVPRIPRREFRHDVPAPGHGAPGRR